MAASKKLKTGPESFPPFLLDHLGYTFMTDMGGGVLAPIHLLNIGTAGADFSYPEFYSAELGFPPPPEGATEWWDDAAKLEDLDTFVQRVGTAVNAPSTDALCMCIDDIAGILIEQCHVPDPTAEDAKTMCFAGAAEIKFDPHHPLNPPCPYNLRGVDTTKDNSTEGIADLFRQIADSAERVFKTQATTLDFMAGIEIGMPDGFADTEEEWSTFLARGHFLWLIAKLHLVHSEWKRFRAAKAKAQPIIDGFREKLFADTFKPEKVGIVVLLDQDPGDHWECHLPGWHGTHGPPGHHSGIGEDPTGRHAQIMCHGSISFRLVTQKVRDLAWPAGLAAFGNSKTFWKNTTRLWAIRFGNTVLVAAHFTAPDKKAPDIAGRITRYIIALIESIMTFIKGTDHVIIVADTNLSAGLDTQVMIDLEDDHGCTVLPNVRADKTTSDYKRRSKAQVQHEKYAEVRAYKMACISKKKPGAPPTPNVYHYNIIGPPNKMLPFWG